jgi:modulator of FtsH protease HflK
VTHGAPTTMLRWARHPGAIAGVVLLAWIASGLYVVDNTEHGVLQVFGRVTQPRVPPGLHYRPPWPASRLHRVDTSTQHTMSVGFKMRDLVMGIPTPPEESRWLTGDTNIIEVRMVIQYRTDDPARYLLGADDTDDLVRRAGEAVVTDLVGHTGVEVLTTGRGALVSQGHAGIQILLDRWDSGVTVTSVNFESVDPPREVVEAFHDVQSAKADNARLREEAQAWSNRALPDARGEAARLRAEAQAFREVRVAGAEGWSSRFTNLAAAYSEAPRETRSRLYLETAEEVLSRGDLMIVDPQDPDELQRIVIVRETAR